MEPRVLDPAQYRLELGSGSPSGTLEGSIVGRSDGRRIARFQQLSLDEAAPAGHVCFEILDPSLALSDAVFLVAVLLFTGHHRDAYLNRPHDWCFVDESTRRRIRVVHPPKIETAAALLSRLPVVVRVRLLVLACELAVPVWTRWAATGDLTYFDGILSMESVPSDLAEATIAAVKGWLEDGETAPLAARSAAYRTLHWPMLEDEFTLPKNAYYSAFAACNLARCALGGGDLELAGLCIRQAIAARSTDAEGTFLGEPLRRVLLLRWWRDCLGVLCESSL